MKRARWMTLTVDRGGVVQTNLEESVGRGAAQTWRPIGDETIPLADFTEAEQEVLLDALAIVARYHGADPAPLTEGA